MRVDVVEHRPLWRAPEGHGHAAAERLNQATVRVWGPERLKMRELPALPARDLTLDRHILKEIVRKKL